MSIEGKLANRTDLACFPRDGKVACGNCKRKIKEPETITIKSNGLFFICKSYIGTSYFVYETRASFGAICYCSENCAKKHNHRFKKDLK